MPAEAQPGEHSIVATGRESGYSAEATFLVRTDWRQRGFDAAHAAFNRYENVIDSSNVSQLEELWTRDGVSIRSAIMISEGTVYLSRTSLVALDASTGDLLWQRDFGRLMYSSDPVVKEGVAYVGTYNDNFFSQWVYALDAATGEEIWKSAERVGGYTLTLAGNLLYSTSPYGSLYALDARTGDVVWRIDDLDATSVAVKGGVLFAGECGGVDDSLYAIDPLTAEVLWTTAMGCVTGLSATASAVYVNTSSYLWAIDSGSGEELWNAFTGGVTTAAAADGSVYVGSDDHYIYALDGATGSVLWRFGTGGQARSDPAIANGVLYAGSEDGYVYALEATLGLPLWKVLASPSTMAVSIVDGTVFVPSLIDGVTAYGLPVGPEA